MTSVELDGSALKSSVAFTGRLACTPDYIDAMFNLALLLQRNGAFTEAADYWRRYLASDRSSEWASRAGRSLKFCEIQLTTLASASGSADSDKAA